MPKKAWNAKRERQYEHIKDSLLESGKPEPLAEEIAVWVLMMFVELRPLP